MSEFNTLPEGRFIPEGQSVIEGQGVIKNMALLDLSHATDSSTFAGITAIKNVGAILIPKDLAGELYKIPMKNVGDVIFVPGGARVKTLAGQTRLSGEAFAAAREDEVWIIVGQVHITTPVQNFTGAALLITGQVSAPRGSETALTNAITKLTGQILYFPLGARFVMGQESWSREFLELLPAPVAFVIVGAVTVKDDVTVELLREKVTEITLIGHIKAPQVLLPMLQVLTVEKLGEVTAHTVKVDVEVEVRA